MSLANVLDQLQNEALRERALMDLGVLLLERRETDRSLYRNTGHMLYFCPGTKMILLQEWRVLCRMIENNTLTSGTSRQCMNVLAIFECIVSHPDARERFIADLIPNLLLPAITHASTVDVFEHIRVFCLSVFLILCEDERSCMFQWVIDNQFANTLKVVLDIGNEFSKETCLRLIEVLIRSSQVLDYICSGQNNCQLLASIIANWDDLIQRISSGTEFSYVLLFPLLLCFIDLRLHPEGQRLVKEKVHPHLGSLIAVTEAFPHINQSAKLLKAFFDNLDR